MSCTKCADHMQRIIDLQGQIIQEQRSQLEDIHAMVRTLNSELANVHPSLGLSRRMDRNV